MLVSLQPVCSKRAHTDRKAFSRYLTSPSCAWPNKNHAKKAAWLNAGNGKASRALSYNLLGNYSSTKLVAECSSSSFHD